MVRGSDCCVSLVPRCAAFRAGRGGAECGAERRAQRHQLSPAPSERTTWVWKRRSWTPASLWTKTSSTGRSSPSCRRKPRWIPPHRTEIRTTSTRSWRYSLRKSSFTATTAPCRLNMNYFRAPLHLTRIFLFPCNTEPEYLEVAGWVRAHRPPCVSALMMALFVFFFPWLGWPDRSVLKMSSRSPRPRTAGTKCGLEATPPSSCSSSCPTACWARCWPCPWPSSSAWCSECWAASTSGREKVSAALSCSWLLHHHQYFEWKQG